MSYYHKYRPNTFGQVRGNAETVMALEEFIARTEHPHVYLFSGPSGCGKTTIGRILAKELGCVGDDFKEIDSSTFRGIDSIREVRKQIDYLPIEGTCRVWLFDECFAKKTPINTPQGTREIQTMNIGDPIFSLAGTDTVKHVFTNKVPLHRVMRLHFYKNITLFCSIDHLFFTTEGWKKACELNKNDLILRFNGSLMDNINRQNGNEKMFDLWGGNTLLPQQTRKIQQTILQQQVCGGTKQNIKETRNERRFKKEKVNCKKTIPTDGEWNPIEEGAFHANAKKQSDKRQEYCFEDKGNEKNQWNTSCLERRTRGEREYNRTSEFTSSSIGMGDGISNLLGNIETGISDLLQSGHREQGITDSNRGGRRWAQDERSYIIGFEENRNVEYARLESSAIYQRGNNDRSFSSIIEDQERNQGFVEFYDLSVEKHPSYFANDIAVHNCHKWTNDAQNASLKMTEDTPAHIYFIFCTTEPQKLIEPLRKRCQNFKVTPLKDDEMTALLKYVVKKEKQTLPVQDVIDQIIEDSMGGPREALNILEKVLTVPAEHQLKIAKKTAEEQQQAIELCRALFRKASWKEISTILKDLTEDPEELRRMVLGYFQAVLLNKADARAAALIEIFWEPLYNIGKPGLVYYCYSAVH